MATHPLAGHPVPADLLPDIPQLLDAYHTVRPDQADPAQRVAFGTSGHRGTSPAGSFNEDHILAIAQAISEFRAQRGISGPLYMGMDTHALSAPAHVSAVEVFAANGVELFIQRDGGYTPTPVISHAILTHNRGRAAGLADGIVITPSHNPPSDGGFKYNPPEGGPAAEETTRLIQDRANEILRDGLRAVRRLPYAQAQRAATTHAIDFVPGYVDDLEHVIDMAAIREAGLTIGVDPLGGAGIGYWEPIAERYGLAITVVNTAVDPHFSFMTLDHDGRIRMDCSSPYAMAGLIALKDDFDIAFGNDPDYDRHGIVTRSAGLLNPNAYLATAVWYLFRNRPGWRPDAAVGKTLVSSSMIDRIAADLGRALQEVPVGFKYFVDGLLSGAYGFGGEESAGASFLRHDGTVWTTDKDGIIMDLLAAEMLARTGRDPGELYAGLTAQFGTPYYARTDAPATREQGAILKNLSADQITAETLAGRPITAVMTTAPANGEPIGGVKVVSADGWFAARPSGTEPIYKIYAESFISADHLATIQTEAQAIVGAAFLATPPRS
jgi:phosphoglucomutase